jgi:hypothetical protein
MLIDGSAVRWYYYRINIHIQTHISVQIIASLIRYSRIDHFIDQKTRRANVNPVLLELDFEHISMGRTCRI